MAEPEEEDSYGTLKPPKPPERPPPRRRVTQPVAGPPEAPAEAPAAPPVARPAPAGAPAVENDFPGGNRGVPAAPPPQTRTPPAAAAPARQEPPIPSRPAAEYCRLFPLGDAARELLVEKQPVLPYLYRLIKQHLYVDAVRLLAHALPRQEGIGWACQCARAHAGPHPSAPTAAALQAVETWLAAPTEANRRAAAAAGAAFGAPAGSAALAVFLSGGSLAPAHLPVVPSGEHLASRAVANAVLLAALAPEPEKAPERYFQYLKDGIARLTGAGRGPEPSRG